MQPQVSLKKNDNGRLYTEREDNMALRQEMLTATSSKKENVILNQNLPGDCGPAHLYSAQRDSLKNFFTDNIVRESISVVKL